MNINIVFVVYSLLPPQKYRNEVLIKTILYLLFNMPDKAAAGYEQQEK